MLVESSFFYVSPSIELTEEEEAHKKEYWGRGREDGMPRATRCYNTTYKHGKAFSSIALPSVGERGKVIQHFSAGPPLEKLAFRQGPLWQGQLVQHRLISSSSFRLICLRSFSSLVSE